MGSERKMTRIIIAIITSTLYYTNVMSGTTAIVLSVVAIIFAIKVSIVKVN